MSYNPATLFGAASPNGEESLLLDDLVALVAVGLVEERSSPNGPVYALTALGREVDEFGADTL